MGPAVCVWGGDGRNITIFYLKVLIFQCHNNVTVLHRRGGVMLLLPFLCCICSRLYMSVYYMPLFVCLYTMLLRHLRVA